MTPGSAKPLPPRDQPAGEADSEPDPESVARSILLRQLTYSAKSRKQLEEKLLQRNVPQEVANAVLNRFEEVGLVDDQEFARQWVNSRARSKGLASGSLRRELQTKGIKSEIIEDTLAGISAESERERGFELVERKLRSVHSISSREEREKLTRRLVGMLSRKGYSPGLARSIVQESLNGLEQDQPEES